MDAIMRGPTNDTDQIHEYVGMDTGTDAGPGALGELVTTYVKYMGELVLLLILGGVFLVVGGMLLSSVAMALIGFGLALGNLLALIICVQGTGHGTIALLKGQQTGQRPPEPSYVPSYDLPYSGDVPIYSSSYYHTDIHFYGFPPEGFVEPDLKRFVRCPGCKATVAEDRAFCPFCSTLIRASEEVWETVE